MSGTPGTPPNDGGGNTFLESLPEDLRSNPSLEKFTSNEGLAKSYVEMQALLGSKVTKPGPDATPEQIAEFYADLVPEKYELAFDDLKVMGRDEVITDQFLEEAKKQGVTNKQAQFFLDKFRSILESKETAVTTQRERLENERKAAFENQFGEGLESNKQAVDAYLKKTFGDQIAEHIKDSEAYNSVEGFQELLKKARSNAPDPGLDKNNSSGGEQDNKENLEKARDSMLNGSHPVYKNAVMNINDPKHIEAQREFEKIQLALQNY